MERRIIASQAVETDDGKIGLRLDLDDGSHVFGLVDERIIRDLRGQLQACEDWLASPNRSAE